MREKNAFYGLIGTNDALEKPKIERLMETYLFRVSVDF